MRIHLLLLSVFLITGGVFAQAADRNSKKSVKSNLPVKVEKQNPVQTNETVVGESVRTIETHANGTKTVIISFTEKMPSEFNQSEMERARVSLATLKWTKEDLTLYLQRLAQRRSEVSKQPDAHALALQNGWYTFMDSVYIEAFELLKNLK